VSHLRDAVLDAAADSFEDSPIARENRLPGSDDLALTRVDGGSIEGYTSSASAVPGETIELRVNVDVDQDVRWDLFRIGDYQGHGARKVATSESKRVAVQPPCPLDAQTGLIECHWASAFDIRIADDWVTGYYLF